MPEDYGFGIRPRPEPRLPLDQQTAVPIRQIIQRLDSGGTAAAVEHQWIRVWKSADEIIASDAVLSNDSMLQFSMLAGTAYDFRLRVWFDTAATPDFKWALVGPAGPTRVRIARRWIIPGGAAFAGVAVDTAGYTLSQSLVGAGTTGGYIEADGAVLNGATPGTFAFQWAQDTSDVASTWVLKGSFLEYSIVS